MTILSCFDDDDDIPLDICEDIDLYHNIPPEDADTRDAVEDAVLATIAIDQALAKLPPPLHAMMELLYAHRVSLGYDGVWPPTTPDVGRYLGDRFYDGAEIPVRTVWRWHAAVLRHWRARRVAEEIAEAFDTLALTLPSRPLYLRAA